MPAVVARARVGGAGGPRPTACAGAPSGGGIVGASVLTHVAARAGMGGTASTVAAVAVAAACVAVVVVNIRAAPVRARDGVAGPRRRRWSVHRFGARQQRGRHAREQEQPHLPRSLRGRPVLRPTPRRRRGQLSRAAYHRQQCPAAALESGRYSIGLLHPLRELPAQEQAQSNLDQLLVVGAAYLHWLSAGRRRCCVLRSCCPRCSRRFVPSTGKFRGVALLSVRGRQLWAKGGAPCVGSSCRRSTTVPRHLSLT